MDPDAALAQVRTAIHAYFEAQTDASADAAQAAAEDAITAMVALDSWLSMGGFLPAAWQAKQNGYHQRPQEPEQDEHKQQEGRD